MGPYYVGISIYGYIRYNCELSSNGCVQNKLLNSLIILPREYNSKANRKKTPIHQPENKSKLASPKEFCGGKGQWILDATPECGTPYSPFPKSHQGLESSTLSLQYSLAAFLSAKWRLWENPWQKSRANVPVSHGPWVWLGTGTSAAGLWFPFKNQPLDVVWSLLRVSWFLTVYLYII